MEFHEWWNENIGEDLLAGKERAQIAWDAAIRAEREACAKVCENLTIVPEMQNYTSTLCAAEIRMRSNASNERPASAVPLD